MTPYKQQIFDNLSKNWEIAIHERQHFSIRFNDERVKLEGTVGISVTETNGHHTVRVAYYNYAGVRKDNIIIKDASTVMACSQIRNFIKAKEADVIKENDQSWKYRAELGKVLGPLGFVRDCDSKYMAIYKSDSVMLTFNFEEDMSFRLGISKNRKKIADKPIELSGTFTSDNWKSALEGCINRAKQELGVTK